MKQGFLLFFFCLLESVWSRNPVILVPGLVGSTLYGKADKQIFPKCSIYHSNTAGARIWLSLFTFLPKYLACWKSGITLLVNSDTNNIHAPPGFESGPLESFDTPSVAYLDYFLTRGIIGTKYMNDIVVALQSVGYVRMETLYAFPYDWRLPLHQINVEELKTLVEAAYSFAGNNQKVHIIAHSYGALVSQKLFHSTTKEWKAKYILDFIPINAATGGSMKSVKAVLSGYDDFISFDILGKKLFLMDPYILRDMARTMGSMYSLLPSELLWKDETIVKVINVEDDIDGISNVSIAGSATSPFDSEDLFDLNDAVGRAVDAADTSSHMSSIEYEREDQHVSDLPVTTEVEKLVEEMKNLDNRPPSGMKITKSYTVKNWMELLGPSAVPYLKAAASVSTEYTLNDPGVPTICIYSLQEKNGAENILVYTDKIRSDTVKVVPESGDGSVSLRANSFCTHWKSTIYSVNFHKIGHFTLFSHSPFLFFLRNLVHNGVNSASRLDILPHNDQFLDHSPSTQVLKDTPPKGRSFMANCIRMGYCLGPVALPSAFKAYSKRLNDNSAISTKSSTPSSNQNDQTSNLSIMRDVSMEMGLYSLNKELCSYLLDGNENCPSEIGLKCAAHEMMSKNKFESIEKQKNAGAVPTPQDLIQGNCILPYNSWQIEKFHSELRSTAREVVFRDIEGSSLIIPHQKAPKYDPETYAYEDRTPVLTITGRDYAAVNSIEYLEENFAMSELGLEEEPFLYIGKKTLKNQKVLKIMTPPSEFAFERNTEKEVLQNKTPEKQEQLKGEIKESQNDKKETKIGKLSKKKTDSRIKLNSSTVSNRSKHSCVACNQSKDDISVSSKNNVQPSIKQNDSKPVERIRNAENTNKSRISKDVLNQSSSFDTALSDLTLMSPKNLEKKPSTTFSSSRHMQKASNKETSGVKGLNIDKTPQKTKRPIPQRNTVVSAMQANNGRNTAPFDFHSSTNNAVSEFLNPEELLIAMGENKNNQSADLQEQKQEKSLSSIPDKILSSLEEEKDNHFGDDKAEGNKISKKKHYQDMHAKGSKPRQANPRRVMSSNDLPQINPPLKKQPHSHKPNMRERKDTLIILTGKQGAPSFDIISNKPGEVLVEEVPNTSFSIVNTHTSIFSEKGDSEAEHSSDVASFHLEMN